ncbi:MAG TPA: hypothetical protein VN624_19625, partial [Rhodanobacter sp.]|nr:hypothetical protein [Rhodanobacter sp.]
MSAAHPMHCTNARCTSEASTGPPASPVGLSRSAPAQRFSQLIGMPPMRDLTHRRLRRAAGNAPPHR